MHGKQNIELTGFRMNMPVAFAVSPLDILK